MQMQSSERQGIAPEQYEEYFDKESERNDDRRMNMMKTQIEESATILSKFDLSQICVLTLFHVKRYRSKLYFKIFDK